MNFEALARLILVCITMAVGSFIAGCLPLSVQLSDHSLQLISTLAAGLILGTSLIVIIPEGMQTVYAAKTASVSVARDVGLSLMVGFSMMLFIDQLGHLLRRKHQAIPLDEDQHHITPTPTLGFVLHGCADGIAIGAAFVSDESSLEWIIFLAIMLHKAPSAFSMATFLLFKKLPRHQILKRLLLFSLAAPVGAILTFIIVSLGHSSDDIILKYRTGIILLFSAGTFLYIASIHVLPEIYQKTTDYEHEHKGLSYQQCVALAIGMFTPLAFSGDH